MADPGCVKGGGACNGQQVVFTMQRSYKTAEKTIVYRISKGARVIGSATAYHVRSAGYINYG